VSCIKRKYNKNSILIIILISLGMFYPLIEGQEFLLNNKEDASKVQGLDLNQVQFDQDSILKWKEQYLKADKNKNGISDALEARLKDSAEVRSFNEKSNEHKIKSDYRVITNDIFNSQYQTPEQIPLDNIPIIVLFPEGDYSSNSLFFEELGGSIKSTYNVAINGFAGRIGQNTLNEFCDSLREQNIPFFIEEDRIYQAQLYYAGRNMNLRPYVWNTLTYDGDQYSSIAIIDTGVDDSHNFFSPGYPSKIVGWRDEVNLLSSPYDDNGHGSHTSGIASGIGTPSYDASGRSVTTAAYEFDNTGYYSPIGTFMYDWTRFNVTDPGLIELFCEFDDFTPGPDDVDLYVYLYYGTTMVDSYEVGSDSWSHTLSYTATSGSLGAYSFRLLMTTLDYSGDGYVSDLKIRFRSEIHWPFDPPQFGSGDPWKGVAPDAKLVGVKVLDQYGYGSTSDIVSGIDWVITNRMVYNITTMSLSLGGGSGDTAMINAVNTAVENGIVTVVSAGNSGPGGNLIGSPGDADNVITVAAMSIDDQTTDYSSQGGPSYTGNTVKPDITAPGGSLYNLQMFSTDTNDNDASGAYLTDVYANDLDGAQGTSMSAPAVAGASNLLIEAMGGHQSWGYTATEAKRVKALLLMSATETYPLLRETSSTAYSPVLNRGGKDVHEGYGRLNVDVAIEAYTQELTIDSQFNAWITSSLVNPFNKHGLGCYANLINGQNYVFTLDVPSGADFDLHLYSDNPSSIGEPIMVASSTSTGLGTDEVISYTATSTGKYYLIAKAISGEGNAIISYPIIDHDLSVSLEVPSSPDIGNTYIINAIVTNTGNNDETNVDLLLYFDGVLVNSTTVSTLSIGTSQTIKYMWIPPDYRTYNFTAYVPPIPSETIIVNNIATELLAISNLKNYIMVPDYTYTWIDASGGTELFLGDDDYAVVALPFNFQFYNDTFSTVYLGSNGYLSFTDTAPLQFSNVPFPSGDPSHTYMIAPFWDDLTPPSGGHIYVQSFGTYWVAEWLDINHYAGPLVGSFQVILYETGEIVFNYDYLDATGYGYTCGLNLGVDTQYYNTYQGLDSLTDNFAIHFTTEVVVLDHDLSVSLGVPFSPNVGDTYMVNATVTNMGLDDETNVDLLLYLDNLLVDSTTISILPVGASEIINYIWIPPDYGLYNFTAYAPPVPSEVYLANNLATELVPIMDITLFDGMFIDYTFTIFGTVYPSQLTWSYVSGDIFHVDWVMPSQTQYWDVDTQTRITQGSSGGFAFGSGVHTPIWIFTDVSLGDQMLIAVDAEGDHLFEITSELIYDLPGFGPVEVWELEDLTVPGGIAWYEKSTGILLNATFLFSGGFYSFDFVDTNVPFSYIVTDHELSVSLEVPSSPDVGEPYIVNATVFNDGNYDESNVDLFLYLDTVLVDSTTITTLPIGASETINYLWTPPDYGTYNFTAYAPPVPSEAFTGNNLVTEIIQIIDTELFDGMYIDHIFTSDAPYSSTFSYTPYSGALWYETLDIQGLITYTWIVDAQTRLMSGGSVFMDGAHTPVWIFTDINLGDTVPISVDGEGDHSFLVSDERIYDIPGFGLVEIWELEDLTFPGGIAWYEKSKGVLLNGTFLFSGGFYSFDFVDTNVQFSYITLDHELKVSLEVPSSPDIGNTYIVNATVFNNGNYDESNVDLLLYLDTVLVDSTTISTLPVGASETINYMWTPPDYGTYNFTAYAPPVPSEAFTGNNLVTEIISIRKTIFFEDFESGLSKWETITGLWHLTDDTSIWSDPYHSPTHSMWFGDESTGTFDTGLQEYGELVSYPIDLSSYGDTILEFYHWREGEGGSYDVSYVYISIDGINWDLLYQSSSAYIAPWEQVSLDISGYAGNPSVQLRFYFDTLDGIGNDYRGWLVDDIEILGTPFLTITAPDSTSVWETGTSQSITWTSTGSSSDVKLELYENDVLVMEIVASTPNDGEYSWTIPSGLADSTLYQVLISDVVNPATDDLSDYFEIFNPIITITAPDSTSVWETGTSQSITWTSTGSSSDVKLELYENDVLVMEIVASTPNDGEYSWTIPSGLADSTLYQVLISDVVNPATDDLSDYFEIFNPIITITAPDSTSVWETGTSQSITWTSTGSSSDVKLELYENDVLVMEIVASTPNDGEYSWTIPSGLADSTLYQVLISDVANLATDDFSDYFEIFTVPDTITVTIPDGLTAWETGTTHSITWTSTGGITNVKIELYKGDVFDREIVASTPNDGSYDWTIPIDLDDDIDYKIKISDVSNPATYDESPNFALTRIPLPPGIPGYDVYLIIGVVCMLSIILVKRRFKKSIKF